MSFDSIPILDLSQARDPKTKAPFLSSLRHALLGVGFLYISNTGIDGSLIEDVITQGKAFFDLPPEEKLKVQMKNVPSFLGQSPNHHYRVSSQLLSPGHDTTTAYDAVLTPSSRLLFTCCRDDSTSIRPTRAN